MFKSIIKGSSLILILKVVSALFSILVNIIISRLYGAKIYGQYSLFYSVMSIMVIFNLLGLDLYVIKIFSDISDEIRIKSFLKKTVQIIGIIGVIVTLCFFAFSKYISDVYFDGKLQILVFTLGFFVFAFSLIKYIGAIFRATGDILYFSLLDGLVIQLPIFSVFLYFYLAKITPIHPVWILYLGTGIALLFSILAGKIKINKSYGSFKKIPPFQAKILKYSYPMMLTSSIVYLMSYLDTLLIGYYLDSFQVGLYSGIVRLALPFTFLSSALTGYIAPHISKYYSNSEYNNVKKVYRSSMLFLFVTGLAILIIYFFFGHKILNLFGAEFVNQTTPFRIYILSTFLSGSLFGPIGYFLVLTDHQKQFLYILLISLVMNIILNVILIPYMGISGAAIAILAATVFWKATGYVLLRKKKIL